MKRRTKHKNAGFWLLAMSAIIPFHSFAAGGGTLAGSVVDSTGRPVAGAHVLVNHAPSIAASHLTAPPVITGSLAATAVASSKGTFSALAPFPRASTSYAPRCPHRGSLIPATGDSWLRLLQLPPERLAAGVTVTMAVGAVVPIHISDPLAMLAPVSGSQMNFDPGSRYHKQGASPVSLKHRRAAPQAGTSLSRFRLAPRLLCRFGAPT